MDTPSGKWRIATVKRISGSKRQRKGLSFGTQADACHDFALANNGVVVHEIEWTMHSWSITQKDYDVLIDLARHKMIDAVLMYRMDRFGRNNGLSIERCDTLEYKYGVKIWSVKEGINLSSAERDAALGRAKQESIAISQRVYPNLRAMAQNGLWSGPIPFGFESDKSHLDEDGEILRGYIKPRLPHADVLREMYQRAASGDAVYAITDWLNHDHAALAKGGTWWPQTVLEMLRSKVYIGRIVYDRRSNSNFAPHGAKDASLLVDVEGKHQALVDPDVWHAVQRKLDTHAYKRSRGSKHAARGRLAALHGLATCAMCGRAMYVQAKYDHRPDGTTALRADGAQFRCAVPRHVIRSVAPMQRYVLDQLDKIVMPPERLELARKRLERAPIVATMPKRQHLQAERKALLDALDTAGVKLARGIYTDDEYTRIATLLRADIASMDQQIATCVDVPDVRVCFADAERYAAQLGAVGYAIRLGLLTNAPHVLDTVAEVLAATIRSVAIPKVGNPVIDWQPWVHLLLDEGEAPDVPTVAALA